MIGTVASLCAIPVHASARCVPTVLHYDVNGQEQARTPPLLSLARDGQLLGRARFDSIDLRRANLPADTAQALLVALDAVLQEAKSQVGARQSDLLADARRSHFELIGTGCRVQFSVYGLARLGEAHGAPSAIQELRALERRLLDYVSDLQSP